MKNVEFQDFMTETWNVQSLYKPGNLTTSILELEQYRLDIIAIQEVRKPGEENLKIEIGLFYSGSLVHQLGVIFIVNDKKIT